MEVAEEHERSSILTSEDERRRPQAWFLALLPVETSLPKTVYMLGRITKICSSTHDTLLVKIRLSKVVRVQLRLE